MEVILFQEWREAPVEIQQGRSGKLEHKLSYLEGETGYRIWNLLVLWTLSFILHLNSSAHFPSFHTLPHTIFSDVNVWHFLSRVGWERNNLIFHNIPGSRGYLQDMGYVLFLSEFTTLRCSASTSRVFIKMRVESWAEKRTKFIYCASTMCQVLLNI